jgi:hypothetical protein
LPLIHFCCRQLASGALHCLFEREQEHEHEQEGKERRKGQVKFQSVPARTGSSVDKQKKTNRSMVDGPTKVPASAFESATISAKSFEGELTLRSLR